MEGLAEEEELRGLAAEEELMGLAADRRRLQGLADEELHGLAGEDQVQGLDQEYVLEQGMSGLEAYVPEEPTCTSLVHPTGPGPQKENLNVGSIVVRPHLLPEVYIKMVAQASSLRSCAQARNLATIGFFGIELFLNLLLKSESSALESGEG